MLYNTKCKKGDDEVLKSELKNAASFLSENYRSKCWYWELVETTRKLLMTSGMFLLFQGSWVHVQITATLSLVFTAIFASIKPMKDYMENIFQMTSLLATFVNLTLVVISLSGVEASKSDKTLSSMLFIATNVILIVIIGCKLCSAYDYIFVC